MKKKYFWPGLVVVILVLGYFMVRGLQKPEYTEITDGPHLQGNPESSVVLVEYSDFQCPACASAMLMVKRLLEDYGDKIRFEYRNFPLTSSHRYAYRAAEAAECAADQGKFWEYHDQLFINQDHLGNKDLLLYAGETEDLDVELWQDCFASRAKSKRVKEDLDEALKRGYSFTPTFLLNGQIIASWSEVPDKVKGLVEPMIPLQNATSSQSYFGNVKFSS